MMDFQALHPKNKQFLTDFTRILKNLGEKKSFSENLTELKKTCQKNSFLEKIVCVCPTVRCPDISENHFWQYGGDIRSKSDRKEGNFFSRYPVPLYQYKKTDIAVETP